MKRGAKTAAIWALFATPLLIAALVASNATVQASASPLRAAPDGRPLQLTFADDFDQFRPIYGPSGVWRTTFGDGRIDDLDQRTIRPNGELQLYLDRGMTHQGAPVGIDPFRAHDGLLDITATKLSKPDSARLGGYSFGSGLITTQPSFSQRYGYFEMRAKLPVGKGLWPAFWLLPADLSWPPEIDVMESIGDPAKVYATAHSKDGKAKAVEARISASGFHIFAVAWDPQWLVWFVDGQEIGRQPTPSDMHRPMFMLANLAIGGGWAGAPDATTGWPATLSVDYIRAYRFAP